MIGTSYFHYKPTQWKQRILSLSMSFAHFLLPAQKLISQLQWCCLLTQQSLPHPVPDPSIQLSYRQEGNFLLASKILLRNVQSVGWVHKHKPCKPKYKQREQSTKSFHNLNLSLLVSFPHHYTIPKTIKGRMISSTSAFFPDPPLSFPKRSNYFVWTHSCTFIWLLDILQNLL